MYTCTNEQKIIEVISKKYLEPNINNQCDLKKEIHAKTEQARKIFTSAKALFYKTRFKLQDEEEEPLEKTIIPNEAIPIVTRRKGIKETKHKINPKKLLNSI